MTHKDASILTEFIRSGRTARGLTLKSADLQGANLRGLRADGLDLEESDLRKATLAETHWKGCVLRDARLDAADFTDAVLRLCDLDQARAAKSIFLRAHLENSTARGARLDGANLTEAVLTDTDFSRASLRGAILERASASGADFRGADLTGAMLKDAVLVDADLRGADLTGAILEGADLRGADLRGIVADPEFLRTIEKESEVELPAGLKALSETMTPIVLEVLRTAGERGVMDPETARRLVDEAAQRHAAESQEKPNEQTLNAVSQILGEMGNEIVPKLVAALQQPEGAEPPPEVKDMIQRLCKALSLEGAASAEDLLSRLMRPNT